MKRLLALAFVAAAAAPLAPAAADHVCVTSGGDPLVCLDHGYIAQPRQICVKSGSQNLVCVF
jgi:hypothetical protein